MVTFLTQTLSTTEPVTQQRVFDYEITSEAQAYYEEQMSIIQYALLDGYSWTSTGGVGSKLTAAEVVSTVQTAIRSLNTWSQYGYVDAGGTQQTNTDAVPSSFSSDSSMSQYMAQALDSLIRTMTAAGFNPLETDADTAALETAIATIQADDVASTPIYNIRSVLSTALSAAANAVIVGDSSTQSNSIQQLLMVDYISSGNEILYNEMNQLQIAVNLNQNILSYLNSLQDLMNQKDAQSFLMSLQDLNSSSPDYALFEKETFGEQILGTVPKFTDTELTQYVALLQIQSLGLDETDPTVQAEYGLLATSTARAALFAELTSALVLTPVPSISSSIISANSLSAHDLSLYNALCGYELSTANSSGVVTLPASVSGIGLSTQYQNGLINSYDYINGLIASGTDLATIQGSPTSYGLTAAIVSNYAGYVTYCSNNSLDYTDTNVSSMYAALQDAAFATTNSDPTSLANQAAAGLGPADTRQIQAIMTYLSDNSMTTAAFATAVSTSSLPPSSASDVNWTFLSEVGLTNVTGTQGNAPVMPSTTPAAVLSTLLGLQTAGTIDTPSSTLSSTILEKYNLTSDDQTYYSAFAYLQALGYNPENADVISKFSLDSIAFTAQSVTPSIGATSVEVLLNLQAAGLDPTDSSVQTEYNLTAQDVSDYNLILQIQAAGEDPTDATVQATWGLVVRGSNLSTAAAGTTAAAFVNVVSGQFNGSGGVSAIIDNLNALITEAKKYVDTQTGASVVSELQQVLADFENAEVESPTDPISYWVQNFSNQSEGTYQAHLNNAVTASQALNDTERANLQQVMFVYQEFYQSASSMLSSLNSLMQTIASNISSQ
jgi:hypothetical protein